MYDTVLYEKVRISTEVTAVGFPSSESALVRRNDLLVQSY